MTRILAAALMLSIASAAQAKPHHHHKAHAHHRSHVHVRHVSRQVPASIRCDDRGCSDWGNTKSQPRERAVAAIEAGRLNLVTVSTAANIRITVASSLAPAFQGFITDLVATGYRPRQIHCFARGGHVRHSNHYSGAACDFDQSGFGKTARAMYHVRQLADKWGLRDGCTFRDCGHVDVPVNARIRSRRHFAGVAS